ncbi:tetratricopeptide repeat protein [bacterium]|nr:tetratricopeptide repeat protein [candidate division CSSED10-310 bacterium]
MAFTGETGALSLSELLSLCLAKEDPGVCILSCDNTQYFLGFSENKLTGISRKPESTSLIDILTDRKLIPEDKLKTLTESPDFSSNLEEVIQELDIVSAEQIQTAKHHRAESTFFKLLDRSEGNFSFHPFDKESICFFDMQIRDCISQIVPDIDFLRDFGQAFPDFDMRLLWISPAEFEAVVANLTLNEIKLLAQYKPGITIRNYLYALPINRQNLMESLLNLNRLNILTTKLAVNIKPPDSRPFLRSLLSNVVGRLESIQDLIGADGEVFGLIKKISEQLSLDVSDEDEMIESAEPENLDDLLSITSSIDDILSSGELEGLDIRDHSVELDSENDEVELEAPANDEEEAAEEVEVKKIPESPPEKTPVVGSEAPVAKKETKTPPPKSSIPTEQELDDEPLTLEEQIEAKVAYRQFISNVTMAYNRLRLKKLNYFEILGVPPNADKKAIHKAFIKSIRKINPKNVNLKDRDKEYLEKAVAVRDKLKLAYKTLTEPKLRRRYLGSLRQVRESEDKKKSEALVLFNRGMAEFKNGNYDKAREIFKKAVSLDPNSPVYYNMLESIEKEERSSNATKFYQAGILAFTKKNDPQRAIQLIKKAIKMAPGQVSSYIKLAEIQGSNADTRKDAIQSFQMALELDPGNHELRLKYAAYLKSIGLKQEAANAYQETLKWNPDMITARKEILALQKEGIKPQKTQKKEEPQDESDG